MNKITIIGAGPAGLFCAYLLTKNGIPVEIYDSMSGPCRKFLIAGSSGLNLTHNEELDAFIERYGESSGFLAPIIRSFTPTDLRSWCKELGVDTFVGSSGRVFPSTMSAAQMLKNWRKSILDSGLCDFYYNHKFLRFDSPQRLVFNDQETEKIVSTQRVIFALGGGSWKNTGSDGSWLKAFNDLGIKTKDFLPMNCGFKRSWSEEFKNKVDNSPLKNVVIKFQAKEIRTECMLTQYGLEGTGIYALSNLIRDEIIENKRAVIELDLRSDLSLENILEKIKKPRAKNSLSNFLRKSLKLTKTELSLLRELLSKEEFNNLDILATKVKSLKIELDGINALDEAISTSGGILLSEVDDDLSLKSHSHMYICGEMLDWDAPTGGYLLQACFSMAYTIAQILKDSD